MSNGYYLVEDLVKLSDWNTNAVKYYVKIGLIQPVAGSGDVNYFGEEAVKHIKTIRKLRRQDTSVQQVIAMMRKEVG